jgi:hypothetical protein
MFRKKTNIIKLSGEIDTSTTPSETRIQPTTGDPWVDFGYWLEATSFMARQAMDAQDWDEKKIKEYMQKYFDEAINDYALKN